MLGMLAAQAYYEEDVEHTAYLRQLVDDLRAQPPGACPQQDLEFALLLLARDQNPWTPSPATHAISTVLEAGESVVR